MKNPVLEKWTKAKLLTRISDLEKELNAMINAYKRFQSTVVALRSDNDVLREEQDRVRDPEKMFAVMIMQGLLASGHYTEASGEAGVEPITPSVRVGDNGPDYKSYGCIEQFENWVIEDALSLLETLNEKMRR